MTTASTSCWIDIKKILRFLVLNTITLLLYAILVNYQKDIYDVSPDKPLTVHG